MAQHKHLNSLSVDSLLVSAKQEGEAKKHTFNSDPLNFCIKYDIRPGNLKIKKNALYRVYSKWSSKAAPVKKAYNEFSLLFAEDVHFYFINQDNLTLLNLSEVLKLPKKVVNYNEAGINLLIKDYNLINGLDRVEDFVLCFLVDKVCRKNKKATPSKEKFLAQLKQKFNYVTYKSVAYFLLDLPVSLIPTATITALRDRNKYVRRKKDTKTLPNIASKPKT